MVPMPLMLLLSIKYLGRLVSVYSLTIRDAFPLPHLDKGLQVVYSSNVFTCFALVQGYLQLASWLWQKMTSRRPHLEQVLQAYMNLLICILACQMLGQVSAG